MGRRDLDCLEGAIFGPSNRTQAFARRLLGIRAGVSERLMVERRHKEGGGADDFGQPAVWFESNRMFDALDMVGVHLDVLIEAGAKRETKHLHAEADCE